MRSIVPRKPYRLRHPDSTARADNLQGPLFVVELTDNMQHMLIHLMD